MFFMLLKISRTFWSHLPLAVTNLSGFGDFLNLKVCQVSIGNSEQEQKYYYSKNT